MQVSAAVSVVKARRFFNQHRGRVVLVQVELELGKGLVVLLEDVGVSEFFGLLWGLRLVRGA